VPGIAIALPFGTWIQAGALVGLLAFHSKILNATTIMRITIFAISASLASGVLAAALTLPIMTSAREAGVLSGTAAAAFGTLAGLASYVALTIAARRQEALPVLRLFAAPFPRKIRSLILRGENPS
jgi:hypothetical protein